MWVSSENLAPQATSRGTVERDGKAHAASFTAATESGKSRNKTASRLPKSRMPFSRLLYRYFFYDWLFHDASRGTAFERAAALRYNVKQARWLPLYLKRWAIVALLFFGAGWTIEAAAGPLVVSAVFYVPACLAMSGLACISAAIVGFWRLT
jgi:hypothetical protein